jgi:predicted ATPase
LWLLGYPDAALADTRRVIKEARDSGGGLAYAVNVGSRTYTLCGNYEKGNALLDEAIAWADEKDSMVWKGLVSETKGWVLAMSGKASDAVEMITSTIAEWRLTGSTVTMPTLLSGLGIAYADLGQFDDAWRTIDEAMATIERTKEKLWEAEIHRTAGEIELKSPAPQIVKAEECFERALAIARKQQAKSWELRAAMSLARLWRDQGKPQQQARELLAPGYGWFTEGFDTLDLKEAKALLDAL